MVIVIGQHYRPLVWQSEFESRWIPNSRIKLKVHLKQEIKRQKKMNENIDKNVQSQYDDTNELKMSIIKNTLCVCMEGGGR